MKNSAPDTDIGFNACVKAHLERIYPDIEIERLHQQVLEIFMSPGKGEQCCGSPVNRTEKIPPKPWSQNDIILITYGNTIVEENVSPLKTLHRFLKDHLKDVVTIAHILPFFPYSSDEGFSVMDYYEVNPSLGSWDDICAISKDVRVMSDLVINHASSRSSWFENFKKGVDPGKSFFVCADPGSDLSQVVRPRTSPLLREVNTPGGVRHVWCTFSHDQVDLEFKNPDVLLEILRIIRFYLDQGIEVFRLDAVAFLWKEIKTCCLHLPKTHEIIKLIRTLVEKRSANALIITETNVPSQENLSYLGAGDEAHIIYNFPLPPLLLNTLVTGDSTALVEWMISVPQLLEGTSCLNFIASHDGIGLRPLEGYLSHEQTRQLIACMKSFDARISTRALNNQETNPYEINISLWDAFKGTMAKGPDSWQLDRFVCAHAIMLCLQGIPAFYIHSLLGTQNDYTRMENLNCNRAINRHIWDYQELKKALNNENSHHRTVFEHLNVLMTIRKKEPGFHPQAGQTIIQAGPELVVIYRTAKHLETQKEEAILCIHNICDHPVNCDITALVTDGFSGGRDLIADQDVFIDSKSVQLLPYQFLWVKNEKDLPRD